MNSQLIMSLEDVLKTMELKSDAVFLLVHLDEIVHCTVKRADYMEYFETHPTKVDVRIPLNDEAVVI